MKHSGWVFCWIKIYPLVFVPEVCQCLVLPAPSQCGSTPCWAPAFNQLGIKWPQIHQLTLVCLWYLGATQVSGSLMFRLEVNLKHIFPKKRSQFLGSILAHLSTSQQDAAQEWARAARCGSPASAAHRWARRPWRDAITSPRVSSLKIKQGVVWLEIKYKDSHLWIRKEKEKTLRVD